MSDSFAESPFRDPSGRAKLVMAALAIGVVVDLVGVGSGISELSLLHQANITTAEADANDDRQGVVGIVQLVMLVITAVVYIMWLYRTTNNARKQSTRSLEYSSGWAIGGWFVPFLNLVRPFQVVRQAWRVSIDGNPEGDMPLVGAMWWAVWLLSGLLGRVGASIGRDADTIGAIRGGSATTLASDVASAIAGVLAIVVVHRITGLQVQRAGGGGASAVAAPAMAEPA